MRKMTREIQNFEKYTYMYVYVCCFFPRSRAVMRNNVDSSNDKSKDLGGLITMVLVCVYQNQHLVNSWFELYYKQLHALNIIRTKFINIVDSSNCSCEKWEDTYHFFYLSLWNIIQIQAYHVWWIVRLLFMHVWFWLHGENLIFDTNWKIVTNVHRKL